MVQDEKAIEEIILRGMEGRDAPGGVLEMAHPRLGTEHDCANPRQSETEVHVLIRRGAMQKEIGELVGPLEGGAPNEAVASAQPIAPAGLAVWGAGCAALATLLRTFAGYAAALELFGL